VAAGLLAAILFGEIPVPLQLLGGGLILGGVIFYSIIEKKDA
jgi:drug/metabolite transporter (DMT)-like permease